MHLSRLSVAAQVLVPSSLCRPLVCSGSQSCGALNTRTQPCCQTPLLSFPLIPPSVSAATFVVLCLQPGHRQLGLPLISPSHPCFLSIRASVHPSIHPSTTRQTLTQGMTAHLICLFLFFCPPLSIHHSPLRSSIHASLWFDLSKNISLRADTQLLLPFFFSLLPPWILPPPLPSFHTGLRLAPPPHHLLFNLNWTFILPSTQTCPSYFSLDHDPK